MSNRPRFARRRQCGLTLVEVLVAVTLIAVLILPAVNALHTGLLGSNVHAGFGRNHYRLISRLETLLAETYSDLQAAAAGPAVASSFSDPSGVPDRLLVFIAAYDADNADADDDPFTGTDDDVLWVRVAVDGTVHNLDTLAVR